jgi:hypothetical protein
MSHRSYTGRQPVRNTSHREHRSGRGDARPNVYDYLVPVQDEYNDALLSTPGVIDPFQYQVEDFDDPPLVVDGALEDRVSFEDLPTRRLRGSDMDANGKAECSICMEELHVRDEVTTLPCMHWFHGPCVGQWLEGHNTCPLCRTPIEPENERSFGEDLGVYERAPAPARIPAPAPRLPAGRRAPQAARLEALRVGSPQQYQDFADTYYPPARGPQQYQEYADVYYPPAEHDAEYGYDTGVNTGYVGHQYEEQILYDWQVPIIDYQRRVDAYNERVRQQRSQQREARRH